MPKTNCRALTINGHSDVSPKFRSLGLAMVLLTLFGAQNPAQAETLYQWKEADGSLTFAPSPPPESSGIAYKVVEPSASVNPVALVDELPTANNLPSTTNLAGSQQADGSVQSYSNPQPAQISNGYIPMNDTQNLRNPLPPGISAGGDSDTPAADSGQDVTALAAAKNGGNSGMEFSQHKSRQCEDLNKRIVALENRMVHSVNGEEMDQAVLAISRYQNSYDHHCAG